MGHRRPKYVVVDMLARTTRIYAITFPNGEAMVRVCDSGLENNKLIQQKIPEV
jgi:hypothetical protein